MVGFVEFLFIVSISNFCFLASSPSFPVSFCCVSFPSSPETYTHKTKLWKVEAEDEDEKEEEEEEEEEEESRGGHCYGGETPAVIPSFLSCF